MPFDDLRFKGQGSQTWNTKFHFACFRQEFAFIVSCPRVLPIRTALIPRSLADRIGFRIQQRIQRILYGLSDKSVEMRPNLFFIDFNRSGDCLFGFLRYIFHGLFSFLWLEFSHYNQSENRPLSRAFFQNVRNFPDVIQAFSSLYPIKMCAISRTLSTLSF